MLIGSLLISAIESCPSYPSNMKPSKPKKPRLTPLERFWAKVEKTEPGCWLWRGYRTPNGYAQFKADGKTTRVHRWAYKQLVGPIPDGLGLDHLCRVRHCVNPAHLEPVTNKENTARGINFIAVNIRKTNCSNCGDLLTLCAEGQRRCMSCRRKNKNKRYIRKKLEKALLEAPYPPRKNS